MIRVLIVDDSPTARALLVAVLGADPEIEIVAEATDGMQGVELAKRLKPDVVTMDIRMPGMGGFEATKEIMIEAPRPIIVVTASVEISEVTVSMQALQAGAVCVLRKPPGPQAPGHAAEARQLVETVKAMAEVRVVRHTRPSAAPSPRAAMPAVSVPRVVAIAASTGGPAALYRLLSELPGNFTAPILVVQHISRGFIPGLASWLNAASRLRVKIADAGDPLLPSTVYLAPDDRHLAVTGGKTVALASVEPVCGFRPSASSLFDSVAEVFGSGVVAVVLTGMGSDGVAGLGAVRRRGGYVLAQDEESSVVFGMPKAAAEAGLVDEVLPLDAMAARLVALVAGSPAQARAAAQVRRAGGTS